ncbi:MAG: DUF6502 family protein [Pseudomonadota bacterium]
MRDDGKRQIANAFLIFMRPLARLLLMFGFGYREFAEIAKTAFVDVATRDHGLRGRPTNISRVAVMTGLTRKEVRRIRDKLENDESSVFVKATPMGDILHRWVSEADYLDKNGRPAELAFSNEPNSFSELVRKFGGDIPPGAMRTELKRAGAIEDTENGKLRLVRRSILPVEKKDLLLTGIMHSLYPLAANLLNNVSHEDTKLRWMRRNIYSSAIRNVDLPKIRRISRDRLVDFSESIDDALAGFESFSAAEDSSSGTGTSSEAIVHVGVYYFEEQDEEIIRQW